MLTHDDACCRMLTQARLKLAFSSSRVCTWAIQLADALAHVHSRRVLHRE